MKATIGKVGRMNRHRVARAVLKAFAVAAALTSAPLVGCACNDKPLYRSGCTLDEIETFDTAIPAGWTVVNGDSGGGSWEWYQGSINWDLPAIQANGGAIIDTVEENHFTDTDLETPLYSLGSCGEATVSFDYYFKDDPNGAQDLGEVYVIPGGLDAPILVQTLDTSNPAGSLTSTSFLVTTSMLQGRKMFSILFHYEGQHNWGWYVDNVSARGDP